MSQETNSPVTFDRLTLSEGIQRALADAGFTEPTEIQARAIPEIMSGHDVIGRSHTGTGKTLAFGIPAIEHCLGRKDAKNTKVLILCPTRELAMQVCNEIRNLTRFVDGVRTVCVYGGQPIQNQIPQLRRGADIVVGTPGRVIDHIHRKTLRMDDLGMIVLDEADEMLDMGFREDIESVLTFAPGSHQTLLFSATMPEAIMDITRQYQTEPVLIETASGDVRTIDTVKQYYFEVPLGKKSDALGLLLHAHQPKLCMIFCNTKKMVEELNRYLSEHGFHCSCLHGDIPQEARTAVMNAFKSGRTPILICTDVAARGIDVDDVDSVYNYDIPQDYEYYIHRIGRTGRAGREGVSYTLAAGRRQVGELRAISRFTGAKIERLELPRTSDVAQRKQKDVLTEIREQLAEPSKDETNALIRELLEETSPERLAEAMLELLIQREMTDVPELIIPASNGRQQGSPLPPVPNGYVRLRFGVGRYQRVAPNHIVAAIANSTRIPGKMIQKIYCYGEYSLVEVPAKFKNLVVKKVNGTKIGGHVTDVRVYEDNAPVRQAQPKDTGVEEAPTERRPRRDRAERRPDDRRRRIGKPGAKRNEKRTEKHSDKLSSRKPSRQKPNKPAKAAHMPRRGKSAKRGNK